MEILISVVIASVLSFIFGRYSVTGSFFGTVVKKSNGKSISDLPEKPSQDIIK